MDTPAPVSKNRFEDLLARLPLTWICLGFLAGILIATWINLPWWIWLAAGQAGVMLALMIRLLGPHIPVRIPTFLMLVILAFSGAAFGSFRYQITAAGPEDSTISRYNDLQEEIVITGTIASPPDVRDDHVNLRVRVSLVDSGSGDLPVTGLILASVYDVEDLQYGDAIRLRGNIATPFETEEFSYKDYLARQGIHSYMRYASLTRLPTAPTGSPVMRWIYAFQDKALARIHLIFPDPEASLLGGILLGDDNGLSAELKQDFNDTGTSHIIAISGFNITILIGVFIIVFGRLFGKRRGTILAIIGILFYVILVGASPTVLRAAIMGTLGIFAGFLGRRQAGLNTLCFAAALMTAFNPNLLWDVGFQLSFFATLGIILYIRPIQEWLANRLARFSKPETARKIAQPIVDYFFITLTAQLTTLPIIAWHFKSISIVSLLANLLILPVQPLVMILGGLALLVSYIYIPLGQIFAWIAWPFPAYTIRMVEWCASLPKGIIHLRQFSVLFVAVYYAILFAFTFTQGETRKVLRRVLTPATILVVMLSLIYLTWSAAFMIPDGRLHITFLPADSAEAILIQTPGGRNILVNGGPSTSGLSEALGRRISPFDRHLDWLIVASTAETQLASLPNTLERIPADHVLWTGNVEASYASSDLEAWLAESSTPVTYATAGMELDLGSGASIRVLDVTSRGALLLIEWDGFRCLLPIGQNFGSLETSEYGAEIGPVTALLLSDAGLTQSNPAEWIDNLDPQVIILSIEAGENTWAPDETMLRVIERSSLLRTDRNGWIKLSTDGEQLWVNVETK